MKLKIGIAAIAAACMATTAPADLVPIGDPIEGDSWAQQFNESGVGSFDTIAILMTSTGDSFESPAFYGFNISGWSIVEKNDETNPTFVVAKGPATSSLTFCIKFEGLKSNHFEFKFMSLLGEEEKGYYDAPWNGGWGGIGDGDPEDDYHDGMKDLILIPLPAPVALAGVGLLGVAVGRRKLRKIVRV